LNIEGLGRQLYPQLDIWQTARPVLKGFMLEQNSPLVVLREIEKNLPEWGRMLPQMPALMHQFIANGAQTRQSTCTGKNRHNVSINLFNTFSRVFYLRNTDYPA